MRSILERRRGMTKTKKKVTINADNGNVTASQETGIKNHETQEKDGIIAPEIMKLVNMGLKRAADQDCQLFKFRMGYKNF